MLRPLTGDFQVVNAFHSALFPTWKVRLPPGLPLGVPNELRPISRIGWRGADPFGAPYHWRQVDVAIVERQRPPGIRSRPRRLPGVEVPPLVLKPNRASEMAGLTADGDSALAARNRTGVVVGQGVQGGGIQILAVPG